MRSPSDDARLEGVRLHLEVEPLRAEADGHLARALGPVSCDYDERDVILAELPRAVEGGLFNGR